ncbi:thiamine biosynthesis protein ThiF [Mucilaginibacter terrigena]|uniref:Thiamine biosynthesis protein ThiF n=1 Tax=Mucilaginibacter terrigena TaxID=2492395 RepID=A0A4Q5LNN4_9SPHI|nr:ThiF family adenylyltransferase [Mucilaginibacter terrigena]RYU90963.1 thiamine biosynthesis protein ThiF [Mucilaginibacter terrigena]
MAAETFSKSLPEFPGTIENPALRDSLAFLHEVIGPDFKILTWDETRLAVPVKIRVDLPTLGNHDEIDIQSIEPVVLVFNLAEYPSVSPMVFTDRLDFPKDKLAHLYIAKNGRPPAFCYVRGNSDEWYANKRIEDLLIRVSNWLRDAAAGELTEDGEQFEPLRLEGYSGTIIYDYDLFAEIVKGNKSLIPGQNYTVALFERMKDEDVSSYKFIKVLTLENLSAVIEQVDKEKKKDKEAVDRKQYHYGYILWNEQEETFANYVIDFPHNWEEFKSFCALYKVDITEFEDTVATADGNYYVSFPVIVGIKRPLNLIGYSSNIEFVNFRFRVDTADVAEGKITTNIPVKIQLHNQPLTQAKARVISGLPVILPFPNVIFGCGALGSKIVMHFARSGQTGFTLIDPDCISPHNLVRHALYTDDEGSNKAVALADKIKKIYPHEKLWLANGASLKDGLFENPDTFKVYKWVMDFTASEAFFNKLVLTKSMENAQICSAGISDFGNLGILLKEGAHRNPRIDDLQAILYSHYKTDKQIREWLSREQAANTNGNLIVQVGVGCNSETTILSDDKVSAHSAYFAGVIKNEMGKAPVGGKIFLNRITEGDEYSIATSSISVEPFDVIQAINDPSWTTRFKKGILEQIKKDAVKAKKNETGGLFTGLVNYKTKTIHITDLISAPPDSKANSICFFRGHQGLPAQILKVTDGSGGQLGYIGEWHSHPKGPNGLSDVDMASVFRFKSEFAELTTPLPVFLTVVTPAGILPFVY